jgi:hypothetical protein
MEKKQTALEFLLEKLTPFIHYPYGHSSGYDMENVIEQAKEMEKQQIKDAVIFGINHGSDECRVFGLDARPYGAKQGAHYINQTYRTNGK